MSNCLVLGADGFIGSHLVDRLAEQGHNVRAVDRFKGGVGFNLTGDRPNVQLVTGDFLNRDDLDAALENIEYVFHFVSTTTPATSAKDPMIDIDTNIRGSVQLFELCVQHNIKRVIYPSSGGAIYGQDLPRPITENDLTEPVSPYAIGKLAIEGYLRYFQETHNLDYLALRISNPYGVRQNLTGNQGVIPIFLNLIHQGLPINVFGDGSMVRDYIYISDLIDMAVRIFDQPTKYHTYNLGTGEGLPLKGLIEAMEATAHKPVKVNYLPSRPTDIEHVLLDISRYREEFGDPKLISLPDGIAKTWAYVLAKAGESA
jgi:UDP-glucose 4-epimerase